VSLAHARKGISSYDMGDFFFGSVSFGHTKEMNALAAAKIVLLRE
jgi:hypothetical protein